MVGKEGRSVFHQLRREGECTEKVCKIVCKIVLLPWPRSCAVAPVVLLMCPRYEPPAWRVGVQQKVCKIEGVYRECV